MKLVHTAVQLDGKKTKVYEEITEIDQFLSHTPQFAGESKTYEHYVQADGREEQIPPEDKPVNFKVRDLLLRARKLWSELHDLTAAQDHGNTQARADIIVDGVVLKKDVPVTTLMFLLKQWTEVQATLKKIPTPTLSVNWIYDPNLGILRSRAEVVTLRTKKVPKVLKKFEPSDKHPGQADVYYDDDPVGEYHKTVFSGALPAPAKAEMLERVGKLIDALKVARETANLLDIVDPPKVAQPLFDYVFGPLDSAFKT